MKYRDENGVFQDLYLPPTGDTLPIGSEVDYDGTEVPYGWEETTDPESYSTNEVKTNKTWIDGKPIYRKVIEVTNPALSATTDYVHGIENVDLMKVKELFVERISDRVTRQINLAYDGGHIMSQGSRTSIAYRIPIDLWNWTSTSSLYKLYIVAEYTKTTD